jgi:hypothetical protein
MLALSFSSWLWLRRALVDYFRTYRAKVNPPGMPLLPDEIRERYRSQPWRLPFEGPVLVWHQWRTLISGYPDTDVQIARRRALGRLLVMLLAVFLGAFFPLLLM